MGYFVDKKNIQLRIPFLKSLELGDKTSLHLVCLCRAVKSQGYVDFETERFYAGGVLI